jgi:hypothetical protein
MSLFTATLPHFCTAPQTLTSLTDQRKRILILVLKIEKGKFLYVVPFRSKPFCDFINIIGEREFCKYFMKLFEEPGFRDVV